MSLSEIDRQLLDRCLDETPRAWEEFVDRFLGLVIHVADHTALQRGLTLSAEQRDDLVAEVFLTLVQKQYLALRHFRRDCSLATYLTVIARRVIVRRILKADFLTAAHPLQDVEAVDAQEARLNDREEVEKLLARLDPKEAHVVRMYHLEGKSYDEISRTSGMPTGSVGPMLSRARAKMKP